MRTASIISACLHAAVLLFAQMLFRKNLMRALMEKQISLPDRVWHRVLLSWVAFFAVMGGLNLWVAYSFDTAIWVDFKLFGATGLIGAQLVRGLPHPQQSRQRVAQGGHLLGIHHQDVEDFAGDPAAVKQPCGTGLTCGLLAVGREERGRIQITAGKGSDVEAVLVDGRVVYRDGKFAGLAEAEGAVARAEKVGAAILDKAGLSRRLAPAWRA